MERNSLRSIFTPFRADSACLIPLCSALTALVLFLKLSPLIVVGTIFTYRSFPLMGVFEIDFVVDRLSWGLGMLVSSAYLLVTIYSVGYIHTHRLKYYSLLTLNFVSMLGLLLARDMLGFYIFFETVSFSAYFLIIHSREREALEAGYKYIVMMLAGGFFILTAMLLLFLAPSAQGNWSGLAGICFSIGCLLKAGAFPFHTWLPDAHPAAPSPISALLSGTMIKVGTYGIVRAFFYPDFVSGISEGNSVFSFESLKNLSQNAAGMEQWIIRPDRLLLFTGALSMIVGVSLALLQKDLKKLLAYHSVSQIGYILLGVGMGKYGLAGGLLHIFSHAIFKGLLFLAVGAVMFRTGIRKITLLGGLWRKMPVTTFTCVIAALSISGVPLTSGYASKGIIFEGLQGNLFLQILFILTSAGTCASFLKLVRHTFFGKPNSSLSEVTEVSGSMYIPMIVLALGSCMLGIFPAFTLNVLLGSFAPTPHLWTASHMAEAVLSLGTGCILYLFLLKIGAFGFEHHEDAGLSRGISIFFSKGQILHYLSIDRFYTCIAQGIFAICVKLEKAQNSSLSVSVQLLISFLVIIIFVCIILLTG